MKLPNKLYNYQESTISKFPIILNALDKGRHLTISDLYVSVLNKFQDTSEFLDALECLYVLGKIEYSFELRRVNSVI
jgi:hypothetical protein